MPIEKQCLNCDCVKCGKQFRFRKGKSYKNLYCSNECHKTHKQIIKTCPHCQRTFTVKKSHSDTKYCNNDCYKAASDALRIQCKNCQVSFKVIASRIKERRFCQQSCKKAYLQSHPDRVTVACHHCKSPITANLSKHQKYCNRECAKKDKNRKLQCPVCETVFLVIASSKKIFCGRACRQIADRTSTEKNCRYCAKTFMIQTHREETAFYCSKVCYKAYLAEFHTVQIDCQQCGKTCTMRKAYGEKFRFCSFQCRNDWQSENLRGANSPTWLGGTSELRSRISATRKYKAWRKAILLRDKYTCRRCGFQTKSNIHAHHIMPLSLFPELMFDLENGLTLCDPCHDKTHQHMGSLRGKGRLLQFVTENPGFFGSRKSLV